MPNKSLVGDFVSSGIGVGVATACTNPIDVVKVRLQLQGVTTAGGGHPPGLVSTAVSIVREEGTAVLCSGLTFAVTRAVLYGGVRLGLYHPIRDALGGDKSFAKKVAAGATSGAIAAAASNPMDLIKTRLQVAGRRGEVSRTGWSIAQEVVRQDGVGALWKGTLAGATRAAVLTASQCATYDEAKAAWMRTLGTGDSLGTQLGASMLTGLVTTTATSPVDVIKTNMFVGGARFSGPLQCAAYILQKDGIRGLFKGWTANYARLGPQTTVTFLVVEKVRERMGMASL